LQELHLKHQQLHDAQCLTVSMDTLHALSYSLKLINVAQNAMTHFDCFQVLVNLEEFHGQEYVFLVAFFSLSWPRFCFTVVGGWVLICNCSNLVSDLEQVQCLTRLPKLQVADFRGNPVCKALRYRDGVVGVASAALAKL